MASSESLPVWNRKATILGLSISFQAVAVFAVAFRLYARFRLVHGPGWDDALVVLALISILIGTTFVCLSTDYGLGRHFIDLSLTQREHYLHLFYVANGTYPISTALIKMSLLFQYLRVYKSGTMRTIAIGLLIFIGIWASAYSFMAWFPCFPIRAAWDGTLENATCYGYFARKQGPFVATFESHCAINLVLDIAVLFSAAPMCYRQNLSKKEWYGIGGLFSTGALIIVFVLWRLVTIIKHQAGWEPHLDFTYYASISIILAVLEVNVAILAANMPIFWPVIEAGLVSILVVREIYVTSEYIDEINMGGYRRSSLQSSGCSEAELNRKRSVSPLDYKDPCVIEDAGDLMPGLDRKTSSSASGTSKSLQVVKITGYGEPEQDRNPSAQFIELWQDPCVVNIVDPGRVEPVSLRHVAKDPRGGKRHR